MNMTRIALAFTLAAGVAVAEDKPQGAAGAGDKSQDKQSQTGSEAKTQASQSSQSQASASGPEAKLLAKLHETNQLEVEFGKLAQKQGSSAEVKDYGKQLEKDHQDADKKIQALAREQGFKIDTAAPMDQDDAKKTADHKAALTRLKGLRGAQFDQEFMKTMTEGHDHALSLVKKNKASIRDEKVKSLLSELEPVLEKHRSTAAGGGHGHDHSKTDKSKTKTDPSQTDKTKGDKSKDAQSPGQTY